MADADAEKRLAADRAVAYVEDGMRVGLGTGSTAAHAIRLLAERVRNGLRIHGVPTSRRTEELASSLGIPLVTFAQATCLDVTIDGADEFDPNLDLIKGGGGALLHEKIVAAASREFLVICDSQKKVAALGAFPLPVEVIPFGWQVVAERLRELGAEPTLRRTSAGEPFVTDEANHILDCRFAGPFDAKETARRLDEIVGVVEHGLFVGMATRVLVGQGSDVAVFSRR